ncbi:MAG: universal stress protein [Bacteroidota bacterium]|nr:universal stress protein [Bacteroidota bacterium]
MLKILIPIDFSIHSDLAIEFGANLCMELDSELHIIHVVKIFNSAQVGLLNSNKLIDVLNEDAEKEITDAKAIITSKYHLNNIKTVILNNQNIADSIENYVNKNEIDLVIMGTHGSSGIESIVMGHVTKSLINISSVPLIAIPPSYTFNKIKTIIYASDLKDIEYEIQPILPLAQLLKAEIHVLHIIPHNHLIETNNNHIIKDLKNKKELVKCQFHIVQHDNIMEGVKAFINQNPTDLLVMYTHALTLYEKLFFEGLTRQALSEKRVPILILKQS